MNAKIFSTVICLLMLLITSQPASSNVQLLEFKDEIAGFSILYPNYWKIVTDPERIIEIQDGAFDLIKQEEMSESERLNHKLMIHVDGSPKYLSNVVVIVSPHLKAGGKKYNNAEDAVQALKNQFESSKPSGTYFLEETYLGNSHAFCYRKAKSISGRDTIRTSYYLTASVDQSYMLVETVQMSQFDLPAYSYLFEQIIRSFRVLANEPLESGPGWGISGEDYEKGEPALDVPRIEGPPEQTVIRENFDSNVNGWPSGDYAEIVDGKYQLDSRGKFPFTVTNVKLGHIGFDFSCEAAIDFLEGDENSGYGVVFAFEDDDNYFVFLINQAGAFLVAQEQDGKVRNIINWTQTKLVQGRSNILMVTGDYQTVRGRDITHKYKLTFKINGGEAASAEIENVYDMTGCFGLFVSEGVKIACDSLVTRNFIPEGKSPSLKNHGKTN